MPDFNVRSDSVNVEQIMEQIRARIREKRGVDYTEQQIRELAAVKLEKFLDPRGVRSDLLDQFRKAQPAYQPPELPNFAFEDATLFESHRAPIRWIRALLMPFLKLLFNPNPLIQALHIQSRLNTINAERDARQEAARRQMDQLYYELVHNLVVETTRTGIEVKNLKMRVESISSRLEFNERRARALEAAVVYKTAEAEEPRHGPRRSRRRRGSSRRRASSSRDIRRRPLSHPFRLRRRRRHRTPAWPRLSNSRRKHLDSHRDRDTGQGVPGEGPGQRSRRRRRRRGRRGGGAASAVMGTPGSSATGGTPDEQASGEAVQQMDALDAMDDDGSPESEETHDAAVERVEQAAVAIPPQVESHVADAELGQARIDQSPVEQPRVESPVVPHAQAAPAAPTEPAPVPPPAPDHADHDPQ